MRIIHQLEASARIARGMISLPCSLPRRKARPLAIFVYTHTSINDKSNIQAIALVSKAHSYRRAFFSKNSKSLEIIVDMYQYTEAFCHYSWNSPKQKYQVG